MVQAERALHRARVDLQQRYRSLALAQGSAAREADSASSRSLLSKWTSSNPAALHLKSVEIEVAAMEKIERQMSQDVSRLRRRKAMREMGRTIRGRLWLLVGWLFSVYCVWKIFVVRASSLSQAYLAHSPAVPRSRSSTSSSATRDSPISTLRQREHRRLKEPIFSPRS